jgi:hypothetical protein
MRFLIPLASLLLCGFSLALESLPHSAASAFCKSGLCRFDQMYQAAASEMSPPQVAALLQQDPNNPDAWCTYAEFHALRREDQEAANAFKQALALAPQIPSIAMRAANFYFTHDRRDEGFRMSKRILSQTRSFDEVLFSYAAQSGLPMQEQAESAIPPLQRPAKSWLLWMISPDTQQDTPPAQILSAWTWLQNRHLADTESAISIVNDFWRRKYYPTAQSFWTSWLNQPQRDPRQILNNPDFARSPLAVPFDWNLSPTTTVDVTRGPDGLDVQFLGSGNVDFRDIHQYAAVAPGRYRLSAEIRSEDLTTDQKPFFQILDAEVPDRFHVESEPTPANTAGFTVLSLTFTIPPQTRAVNLQLVRVPSSKFDNKIQGHLWIRSIHLTAL